MGAILAEGVRRLSGTRDREQGIGDSTRTYVCNVIGAGLLFDNIKGMSISVEDLRRFTVSRSLFKPTTLKRALHRMRFVQADPIRAPARAQDLVLRHRVKNYRAGELEQQYRELGIEEDFFINYGFVTRE